MIFNIRLLPLTLTIAFALMLPPMASTQSLGAREDNTALQGTALTYYQRPSFGQCQADCANNANCKGFTWIQAGTYNANDAAMCYLMSAVTGKSPARGHFSVLKGAAGGGGGRYAGKWSAYSFGAVTIEQNGDQVTGRYSEPGGSIQGMVRGDRLYFSYRHDNGGVGEAVWFPIPATASTGKLGGQRCAGRGCTPEGYYEAQRQ